MKKRISKSVIIRCIIIVILFGGFGSVVAFDAIAHFSYYLNSKETFGEVSSRIYNDEEKTTYNITIDYKDDEGNVHQIEKKDLLTKLVDYPMYDDVYMFYDSKHPEVADLSTRNIYVMGAIILVCYGICAAIICLTIRSNNTIKHNNKIIDDGNYIMADFIEIGIIRKKGIVYYNVECEYKEDDKVYKFTSELVSSDPENFIKNKKESKVKVFVDENNYDNYVVDVSEY